jgi:hypothetical protein
VQSVNAGTSNTAGANFTIAGSQGTGTGAGGSIIFQTAPAGTTGTAQNALATAWSINSSQQLVYGGSQQVQIVMGTGTVNKIQAGPNSASGRGFFINNGTQDYFAVYGNPALVSVPSGTLFSWSANNTDASSNDTYIGRRAAANVNFGLTDAASPVAQTLSVQSVSAGTTDASGANFTITGSQSTGVGTPGSINIQTAGIAAASGTSQNAVATVGSFGPSTQTNFNQNSAFSVSQTWNAPTINVTGASGTSTTATVTFAAQAAAIPVGTYVNITGINPSGYNQVAQVTASNTTSVSYTNTTTTTYVSGGTVQAQPAPAAKINVTNTASGGSPALLDFQVGGVSKMFIDNTGAISNFQPTSSYVGKIGFNFYNNAGSAGPSQWSIQNNGGANLTWYNGPTWDFTIGGQTNVNRNGGFGYLGFGTNPQTGGDAVFSSPAAASIRMGGADAASPVAQTFGVQSVSAGTSNTAGANFTIAGSQGTGTGAGGSIVFQTAAAGTTGTAQNALSTAMTIKPAGVVGVGKSFTVATLPATGVAAGDRTFVSDALTPTFLGTLTGGGTVYTPVFYNGTAWVAG